MLAMFIAVSVSSFAEDNNANDVQRIENYSISVNTDKLANYLELSDDQIESVEVIESELSRDLMFAAVECNDNNRKAVVMNAIKKNTEHMSYVLNRVQYSKYLKVLNATVKNRRILEK
jgi:hypothetical protein